MVLVVYFIFQRLLLHLQLSSHQEFGLFCTPGKKIQSSTFPLGQTDFFFFPTRGICRALFSQHPHRNPWQWQCLLCPSLSPAAAEAGGSSSHGRAALHTQKSSPNPTFLPVPSSRCLFSHLSGSHRDGEEGKVLWR